MMCRFSGSSRSPFILRIKFSITTMLSSTTRPVATAMPPRVIMFSVTSVKRLKYAALIGAGRYAEAERGIDAALRLYPDYVDLHLYKGIILLELDRPDEALEAFRRPCGLPRSKPPSMPDPMCRIIHLGSVTP